MDKNNKNEFKEVKKISNKEIKLKVKRYKKVSLDELLDATTNKKKIEISNQDSMKANRIMLIKRDGRRQPWNPKKMDRLLDYACPNQIMKEELLRDTEIKLHKEIKIQDMYDQLIITAVNKISMLTPLWEEVAARLQLLKYKKESYNLKNNLTYPILEEVLKKGLEHKIYDKESIKKFSEKDLIKLNKAIIPERDSLFNYKGITLFYDKYCLNYSKTKKLELPQITYMRVAMALMINEKNRIDKIISLYNAISLHLFTLATPIMLNAFTPNQQLSSCVLSTLADDTHNIVDTGRNLAIYSKFKGGTSLNITEMRAKGSYIEGTQGISSGPIPFMQFYGKIMKAWNQGGKRPGALAIYFSWWHLDVTDILSLPSNGGTDENRERGLKYALKVNRIFAKAVLNNEDIYLFDPKDVPDLVGKFGKEFEKKYFEYVDKTSIRKKKINARELIEKVFKERTETGKVYLFHEENVNEATLLNRYIGSSNLCCEIILPSRASETITEELLTLENGTKKIVKTTTAGEIALCNLASVNLEKWFYLSDEERWNIIRLCVRALDNTVDLAFYPVKEAKNSNLMYRYLGIGVLNYTNYLALNKIVIDTKEALEETDSLFDDWSYKIITASMELSMEKGKFEKFYETEWADGILPIHKANKKAINLTNYIPDMKKWDELASKVKIYGLRNAQLMAIAPTATSGKAINSIESIEPIANLFYKEEGTITIPTLVPNFRKNNRYYKKNFDCDQYSLIDNGAIRQKYLDQSQSLNIYIKRPDSLMELINIHFYGFDLGLKTFYYIKQIKEDGQEIEEEICESCS